MRKDPKGLGIFSVTILLFVFANGCGGGYNPPPPPKPTATISADPTSIAQSQSTTLTWSCTNADSSRASGDWSGTKSLSGTEKVTPATVGTKSYTLTCTGAGGSASASAAVAVTAPPIVVTVSPATVTVVAGTTQQFAATVTNTTITDVTWSATCGTVSTSGFYIVPATAGTCNVTATSQADPTKSATAVVTVTAPPIVVTVSPATVTVVAGTTQQFAATVTNTTNTAVAWSAVNGAIDQSGLYAAPAAAGTSAVTACSVADNTKCGTATVTIAPAPVPTISILPVSAIMQYGDEKGFQVVFSGNQDPPVCSVVSGPGSVNFGGNTAIYSAPKPTTGPPSVFASSFNCTATNSIGQTATATANITLEYDIPIIISITPATVFCPWECMLSIKIIGSGFYPGGTIDDPWGNLVLMNGTSPTEIDLLLAFDGTKGPGRKNFTVTSPTGHGGGTSNAGFLDYLNNLNTLALSATEVFQLDKEHNGVVVYDETSGAKLRNFNIGGPSGIAIDDITGFIVEGGFAGIDVLTPTGSVVASLSDPNYNFTMGVAARGGYVCATELLAGLLACSDLTTLLRFSSPVVTVPVGNTPWLAEMTAYPGVPSAPPQLASVVFNAGDSQLSVVKVPQMALWNSTTLVGIAPMSQLRIPPDGGWQMAVIEFSPTVKVVAVLSQHDKTVVFTGVVSDNTGNLTLTDLGTATLDGVPFRIAADNVHGTVVVALDDNQAGRTKFAKISPQTGAVTELQSTTPLLAVGFAVSPDGSRIIGCEGPDCVFLPNE